MELSINFTENHIIINGKKFDRHLIERIIALGSDPSIEHIVDDGFCGVGGVTAGFAQLPGWLVASCINHWWVAIDAHKKNHPDCLHLLEDFRFADISVLVYMHREIKKNNPKVKFHLWLSLECTNFSNAKGGMSRDADSRTLADYADRYVIALNPDVIWIENVKEFRMWGPMIPKIISSADKGKTTIQFNPETDDVKVFDPFIEVGQYPRCPLIIDKKKQTIGAWMIPEKATMGTDFERWKKYICSFGYDKNVVERLLNCADYGIPQHRIRLIMQFNREGIAATYPAATHSKKGLNGLPVWNPVKPCLDLNDEGESVLAFKTQKGKMVPRISSPKTIDRLINGVNRHVLPGRRDETFITKFLSNNPNTSSNNGNSVDLPCATLSTQGRLYPTKTHLVDHYFGNGYMKPVTEPAGVTGTKDGAALHTLQFLGTYHSIGDGSKLTDVSPAIMTKDKYPVITVDKFMDHQFSSGQTNKSLDETSGALLQNPKQRIVSVDRLLMDTQFNNECKDLSDPCGTITANRKHYYLVNFQWFNQGVMSIDKPSNTIIARQDKAPNYLITLETGELAIEVFENDPPHYVRLKKYMAENGIISINMRMLKEIEMLRIMTIPENTKMSSSSTHNKKMIGNAVPSDLIVHLGRAYANQNKLTSHKAA